jgi:hypothetical protein
VRLTVSYAEQEVDISFDYEGLAFLLRSLTELQTYKAPDHDHPMSEDWGGGDLTTDDPVLPAVAHHLSLTLVGEDGGRDEIGSTDPIYRDGHEYGDRKPSQPPTSDA